MTVADKDWTAGEPGILYQRCRACRAIRYFRRDFCPQCGTKDIAIERASGRGVVHAVSVVARAPSAELRAYAPYAIVLVDAEEGFRMMAQGDKTLAIGDAVEARFVDFAGRLIPYFEKVGK